MWYRQLDRPLCCAARPRDFRALYLQVCACYSPPPFLLTAPLSPALANAGLVYVLSFSKFILTPSFLQRADPVPLPTADGAAAAKGNEALPCHFQVLFNENKKTALHPPAYQIRSSLNTKPTFTVISQPLVCGATPEIPILRLTEGLWEAGR